MDQLLLTYQREKKTRQETGRRRVWVKKNNKRYSKTVIERMTDNRVVKTGRNKSSNRRRSTGRPRMTWWDEIQVRS
ncbi:unnamed protein product [Tenebrio molitor]|nr:unnamed protein product [Tenebrio molitor]